MTSTYNEDQARAQIQTTLETVTNIGRVHDYERFADDWDTLVEHYVAEGVTDTEYEETEKLLRGWNVSLSDLRVHEQETFGPPGQAGNTEVTYYYVIRGYHAVDDEKASEKIFVKLALTAIATLDAEPNLHSSVRDNGSGGEFYGPPATATRWDFRMFGDVLVHYCEIGLEVSEVV